MFSRIYEMQKKCKHLNFVNYHNFHPWIHSASGGCLNVKTSSYQYRDSHYKDKTVWRLCYLYKGNTHNWKDFLYLDGALM